MDLESASCADSSSRDTTLRARSLKMPPTTIQVNVQASHLLPIKEQSTPSVAKKMKTSRSVTCGPTTATPASGARSSSKTTNLYPALDPATLVSSGAIRCISSEAFLNWQKNLMTSPVTTSTLVHGKVWNVIPGKTVTICWTQQKTPPQTSKISILLWKSARP